MILVFSITLINVVHGREEKWLTTGTFNLKYRNPDFRASDAPSPSTVDVSFLIYGDLVAPQSSTYILSEKDHVVIGFKMACQIPPESPYDFALGWEGLELWIYNNTYGQHIWTSLDTTGLNLPKGNNILNLGTYDGEIRKGLLEYYNVIPSNWHQFYLWFGFSVTIQVGKLTSEAFHLYFTYRIDVKELGFARSLSFERFGEEPEKGISWTLTDRNFMFIFIITTTFFVATTAYFARKARKLQSQKPHATPPPPTPSRLVRL